ncbi:MAG: MBL fold metallo-hydrolase [Actinomycetota bacterium]|nr:MBL fold metallo-hydrolase [Actinomycetota bacterium]
MNVETFTDFSFGTNSYLVWKEGSKEAILIDAGASADRILDFLKRNNLSLEAILLTHGHPDHVVGVAEVSKATGAKVYLSDEDKKMVEYMSSAFLSMLGMSELELPEEFEPLYDGQKLKFDDIEVQVLHTPGHSPGSMSFLIDDALFDGDLLFNNSVGRTDFPGGSFEVLLRSVKEKVFVLDPETKVYPGHMGMTTVGWEKRTNPFLTGI